VDEAITTEIESNLFIVLYLLYFTSLDVWLAENVSTKPNALFGVHLSKSPGWNYILFRHALVILVSNFVPV
jgi:hypothetical protein